LNVVDLFTVRSEYINLKLTEATVGRGLGSSEEVQWVAIHKCMDAMLGISLYS
jgi:hypothetical protein